MKRTQRADRVRVAPARQPRPLRPLADREPRECPSCATLRQPADDGTCPDCRIAI